MGASTPPAHPSLSSTYAPGGSGSTASDWSEPALGGVPLRTQGRNFVDAFGRRLLMHGCNVSGISKLPTTPNGLSHLAEDFFRTEDISFVGRPFPIEEADEHFGRLRQWGLTFVRLVVTWESLEHTGPGHYDHTYIAYLGQLITLAPQYGITLYIDAHQDVWSRHTGGSGAPHWTLSVVGFELKNLKATGAAHAHNLHLEPHDPPPKVWPSGYHKLAAGTMATVFWAGDTFAPKRRVNKALHNKPEIFAGEGDDVGLEEFLQQSMIEAFGTLADALSSLPSVLGFEVMNEPHRGYVSLPAGPFSFDFTTDLAIGYFPSPVQSWALGDGHPVVVDHYVPSFPVTARSHSVVFEPAGGRRAWKEGVRCLWEEHGVWGWEAGRGEVGEAVALRVDYFKKDPKTGREVEWYRDFYQPFCQKFGQRIAKANSKLHTLVAPIPNEFVPPWPEATRPPNLVQDIHFYDLQALFSKQLGNMSANVQGLARGMFLPMALYFGRGGLKKNYLLQLGNLIQAGYRSIGELPIVIGEIGIPFDLNHRAAFKTGDFYWQERQLDALCSALERHLVSFNLWMYNPLNDDVWGDSWNGENFSWFSRTGVTEERLKEAEARGGEDARRNVGTRAMDAIERPYAAKVAGVPLFASFDMESRKYTFRWANPSPEGAVAEPPQAQALTSRPPRTGPEVRSRETEFYLPRRRYGLAAKEGRLRVALKAGDGEWKYDAEKQTLYVVHARLEAGFEHEAVVTVDGPSDRRPVRGGQQGQAVLASVSLLVALLVALLVRA